MKIVLVIVLSLFCCLSLFAATPPKVGDQAPYHLAVADARVLSLTIYAIVIVDDDGNSAELFYNASGTEVDLAAGADYTSLVNNNTIDGGTYTELRFYTSYTIGLQGYDHYQYDGFVEEPGRYYYTKTGSTHEGILAYTDLMAETGFPNPSNYAVADLEMEEGELSPPSYPASSYPYKSITGICYRRTLDPEIVVEDDDTVTFSLSMSVENGLEFNDNDSDSQDVVSAPTSIHFNVPEFSLTAD